MMERKYEIVDAAEDAAKVGYSFAVFGLKFFYQVSNLEALKNSYDAYALSRFSQAIEAFQFDHEKLSENEKRDFYDDLKYNEQNLHYLYSLFDKARSSTYLLHMKILARLSANLIKNKTLNYHESTFLANINVLNEEDLDRFYNVLKDVDLEKITMKNEKILFTIDSYTDHYIFEKLKTVGLIVEEVIGTQMGYDPTILESKICIYMTFRKKYLTF